MTSDQREFVAQRLAKLLAENLQYNQLVSNGEMTLDQANEQNAEYVERQRAEMTQEEFVEFFNAIGKLNYMAWQMWRCPRSVIPCPETIRRIQTDLRSALVL
jgi:hypothetical protein